MRISVIIPSHNRSAMLREAIDSVLRQNLSQTEVIVCDDGSSEDLAAVCHSYADAGTKVIWSGTWACLGAQVARNRGMALAQGEFVLFLDSDDVLADGGLEALLRLLEEDPTLDYAYGKVVQTDEALQPLGGRPIIGEPFVEAPIEVAGYHWSIMGVAYRRKFLEKVGPWNEELTGSQDWEYQARVKLAGGKERFVDRVVGYWRHHEGARVGTKRFRPDYVTSVMVASQSILAKAKEVGFNDLSLDLRLAKKLVVHAVEWGANGFIDEKVRCLRQAMETAPTDRGIRWLCGVLKFTPCVLDRMALGAARRMAR